MLISFAIIADASHELRTPLAVIETTLDLVISRGENTINSQLKWIENIQAENKRMSKLVNDLLFLARTDSKQVIFEKKAFPLHSALLEAYIPFEAITIQKGIQLKAFKGAPINFIGDEARIKQLVVILIDNAIKHTQPGGTIGMSLFRRGEFIEIIIEDTGEGIEKEHINDIFKRFYKVDKARSDNGESSGLGLSIAQCIVKEHNGTIRV
ncbi:MAG: ATP-binding protein, partial [Clostridiaceae bacterium]|nr:ATP-binding protein [Clostridiaceae bacterium]